MRLLVFEFITGGGMCDRPLPVGLAREGDAMLVQMITDLADCEAVDHIEVLRDPRLPVLPGERITTTFTREDFRRQLAASCRVADLVLPIAPETDGALLEVTELIEAQGAVLLGSRPEAVRLTASKYRTAVALAERGIATVPTWQARAAPEQYHGDWVIKPDIGAGGEGCRLINGKAIEVLPDQVLQPLTPGQAASMTLLCHGGYAEILACNVQRVALDAGGCHLHGLEVNGLAAHAPVLQPLAAAITTAVPGLWGWVGVDFILGKEGPVVLEINPRLTTSYLGLRESLQCNPAQLLLQLQRDDRLPQITCERRPVEVRL